MNWQQDLLGMLKWKSFGNSFDANDQTNSFKSLLQNAKGEEVNLLSTILKAQNIQSEWLMQVPFMLTMWLSVVYSSSSRMTLSDGTLWYPLKYSPWLTLANVCTSQSAKCRLSLSLKAFLFFRLVNVRHSKYSRTWWSTHKNPFSLCILRAEKTLPTEGE